MPNKKLHQRRGLLVQCGTTVHTADTLLTHVISLHAHWSISGCVQRLRFQPGSAEQFVE